ncbi:LysR substrate-binding domain-containing protein [Epibacterium ulvae]|uniref:LysR substrate-binding domain-containing protein n=1 Tax=Epibacterium ulvae TaxID=1156985 RepID=UPI0024902764|nr:LysR substrate-binding domain-containing protein [Epibacterium ulvae]
MQNDGRNILIFGALPILEAAVRHNSFTKAALEFGISQSALSRRIQRLELETGIALFARRGRAISLTEDGARLAEAARLALDLVEAARDSAAVSTEGTLTLGVLPSLGSRWLAPLLAGFRRAYPGVYVRVETIDADFRSDHKDPVTWDPSVLDIVITRGHGGWRTLDAYKLFDEHMIAVRATGEHVETRIGHSTRSGAWQAYLDKAKISIAMDRPGLVFEHYYMVLEAVRSGAGIGLVPLATVKQDLQDGTLVAFGPQVATGASYYAVTAPRNTTRAAPAAFIEWLKDIPTDQ